MINFKTYDREWLHDAINKLLAKHNDACRIVVEVTHADAGANASIKVFNTRNEIINSFVQTVSFLSDFKSLLSDYVTSIDSTLLYVISGIPHLEIVDKNIKITVTGTKLNIDNLRNLLNCQGFDMFDRTQIDIRLSGIVPVQNPISINNSDTAEAKNTVTQEPIKRPPKNIISDGIKPEPKKVNTDLPISRREVAPNVITANMHESRANGTTFTPVDVDKFTKELLNNVYISSDKDVKADKAKEEAELAKTAEQIKTETSAALDNQINLLKAQIDDLSNRDKKSEDTPTSITKPDAAEAEASKIDSVKEAIEAIAKHEPKKESSDDKVADELSFE